MKLEFSSICERRWNERVRFDGKIGDYVCAIWFLEETNKQTNGKEGHLKNVKLDFNETFNWVGFFLNFYIIYHVSQILTF